MTDESPETGQIITVKQAAEILKVSGMTIRRLIDTGRLPAWRVAGDGPIRISRANVEALRVPVVPPAEETEDEMWHRRSAMFSGRQIKEREAGQ